MAMAARGRSERPRQTAVRRLPAAVEMSGSGIFRASSVTAGHTKRRGAQLREKWSLGARDHHRILKENEPGENHSPARDILQLVSTPDRGTDWPRCVPPGRPSSCDLARHFPGPWRTPQPATPTSGSDDEKAASFCLFVAQRQIVLQKRVRHDGSPGARRLIGRDRRYKFPPEIWLQRNHVDRSDEGLTGRILSPRTGGPSHGSPSDCAHVSGDLQRISR